MAITSSYLTVAKNLAPILDAIRGGRAPERFTVKYLEDLGFKSTNDRLIIPLLKSLGLIDDTGTPKQRYFDFLDDGRWKQVLADAVRDAYEDLFRLNKNAYTLPRKEIASKIKSLTQGKFSDVVVANMERTFSELVKLADFSLPIAETSKPSAPTESDASTLPSEVSPPPASGPERFLPVGSGRVDAMTYRIEIVLPAVRDKAIYDAIFRSLREHLL